MRIVRIIAMLLVMAVLLSGCFQQGEVVVIQNERVTIHILAGQSTSDAGSEEMIQQVLQEKFPYVDFQWTCVDWGEGFADQVVSKVAAGRIPDILIGKAQDVAVYYGLGAILPVDPASCAGISQKELDEVTISGGIYGMPYNTLYQGVLYNKSIFEELDLEVPETREELNNVVAVCEAAGVTPFALHYGDSWYVANLNMQLWTNDLFTQHPQFDTSLKDKAVSFAGDSLLTDAFRQSKFMLDHSFADAMQVNQAECVKRFIQGETAMYMTGTWSLQTLTQMNSDMDVGIFPYPNTEGNARLLQETNLTFMKGNSGKNEQLVDEILLEIGTNEELARDIAEFTAADSTFVALSDSRQTRMDVLSQYYHDQDRVENVALGNNQFVWSFQSAVAEKAQEWMSGKTSLNDLLKYMAQQYELY